MRILPTRRGSAQLAFAFGALVLGAASGWAMDDTVASQTAQSGVQPNPNAKAEAMQYEFVVFKKHCTQCHNSVADPERPGKTRDEWYRIINLMEGHGLAITQEEADLIVDLLFSLRRGIEDTPG